MTVTPEGLTITGPEDVYSHAQIHRFLRGSKQRLYPEVAQATTVTVTGDDRPAMTHTSVGTGFAPKITITLSTHEHRMFRTRPWSVALHEWGHAVADYHRYTTHRNGFDLYLQRCGIDVGDRLLDKTYVWTRAEMFADTLRI